MKTTLQKTTLAAAITTTLIACGGGGLAGIGGSGFISSGSVTGFGSIFVNGVEFETDSASFEIDDSNFTGLFGQNKLAVGMRVKVSGTVNPDGVTGTATSVEFEDQLEGPISSACTEDADLENKTCTILGVPVIFNAADTVFVGADYASLAPNDEIQVSGFFDDAGNLRATAAVKKGTFVMGDQVEAKGVISNLVANTFTLTVGNTLLSIDANGADLSQVPGGLADGQFVEVKGNLTNVTDTTFTATLVKLEDNDLDEGAEVEIEGIITRFVDASDFDVDGQKVDASSSSMTPANMVLKPGIKVEVEGKVSNGVLQAKTVKLREGEIKIHATASNVDTTARTFTMTLAGTTGSITVTVDTSTRLEDKLTGNPLTLDSLNNLDSQFLRVRGYDDGSGAGIIATRIRVESPDDEILQGVIQSSTASSVTVLGIEINIDEMISNPTEFRKIDNTPYPDFNTFLSAATPNQTLIKVKDKQSGSGGSNPVGIADEVELQRP